MSDFMREVDDEVRRDRLAKLFSRFQVPLAIMVVLIIAGAAGWRVWTDHKVSEAEAVNARYAAADALAKAGKGAEAQAAFDAVAKDAPAGYVMLARMKAVEAQATHDPEGAANAFDAIANDDGIDQAMRDTARFRGAILRIDRDDPKAFEQRYGRFVSPGFAFHSSIGELLALAAMKRDDYAAAGRYLDAIIVDPLAPSALRNRAEAFRALVSAGPAKAVDTPAAPASVTPETPAAPAAVAPAPAVPMTATPPAPTPASPPAAAATPTPAPSAPAPKESANPAAPDPASPAPAR